MTTLVADASVAKRPDAHPKAPWQPDARFTTPSRAATLWLIATSLVPYIGVLFLMNQSLQVGYWLTLLLAPVGAGFLVRTFIVFHDCTHYSLFRSRTANQFVGELAGILTLSAYHAWRHGHAVHHARAGNLDHRELGDIWTLTLEEYRALKPGMQLWYRIYRNPLFLFFPGAFAFHLVIQRIPRKGANRRELRNTWITNAGVAAMIVGLGFAFGPLQALAIWLPVFTVGAAVGVWLQFVQHQYEGVYWARGQEWNFEKVGLDGSSYLKLPKVLQWFTGNIGLHHIHHLCPRIPNYYLQECLDHYRLLQDVRTFSVLDGLKVLKLHLVDEARGRMISFRQARALG